MRLRWNDLDVCAYTDPASGKTGPELKHSKARQAVVVLAQDRLQRLFVLHAHAARETTEAFMDRILRTNQDYTPRVFGIEANGNQSAFGDTLALRARERGMRLPLVPVWQPTHLKKAWRIRTILQPVLDRLFLQPGQDELRRELQEHPHGALVDLVDALATAVTLLPARATDSAAEEEVRALAQHLRETGVAPSQIAARVAEVRNELGLAP